MEWSQKNKYNSFNTEFKSLTYFERYEAINNWRLNPKLILPPPIEVSLDPIATCQLKCSHCNFGKYLGNKIDRIDDIHLLELIKFFSKWKVLAVCFGGGGCPTLHTKLWDALLLSNKLGMQNSIATNGINFNDKTIDIAVKTCRWIGVSVDSSNSKTYQIGRKANYFDKVIENIKKLAKRSKQLKTHCDISYKFLMFDYNQHEIYEACKLAKSLGVQDFHCRPADFRHQGMKEWKNKNSFYDIEAITKQFEKCRELEDNNFRVFLITHKFNPKDFTPIRDFNHCYASSLCLQINPNGNAFLCPDTRNLDFFKLGEHIPYSENILKFWGSKKHHDLVFKTGCKNCKSRCTFGRYNKMFQDLFIDNYDPLCRPFI